MARVELHIDEPQANAIGRFLDNPGRPSKDDADVVLDILEKIQESYGFGNYSSQSFDEGMDNIPDILA